MYKSNGKEHRRDALGDISHPQACSWSKVLSFSNGALGTAFVKISAT
jgi:hypothetical protein